MDDPQAEQSALSPPNTLNQIHRLVRQCQALRERQNARDERTNDASSLRAKVAELQRKREALEAQLRVPGLTTVRAQLQKKMASKSPAGDDVATEKVMLRLKSEIGKKRKKRNLAAMNHAYRLVGRSTFSVKEPGCVGVCLETSFEGKFLEPYYVVLRVEPLEVHRHTLPYFVPVDDLAKQFLIGNDVMEFLDELAEFAQAFVLRREMLKEFREAHKEVEIVTSAPFDYIEIQHKTATRSLQIVLAYDDLKKHLPERANVLEGSHSASIGSVADGWRNTELEQHFRLLPITAAFAKAFKADD